MSSLRNLILAAGCTAILGTTAITYAEDRTPFQELNQQREESAREWQKKREQAVKELKEWKEESAREWQKKREQAVKELKEWKEESAREWQKQREQAVKEWEEWRKKGNYAGLERRTKSGVEERKTESEQKVEIKTPIVKKPKVLDTERKTFADTIAEKKSYASLLAQPELAAFFTRYPNLKGTDILPATRVTTNVTNPKTLDDILEKVDEVVGGLPKNYAEIMERTNVKVYVAATTEEMRQKCKIKSSGGCYIREENMVCISAEFDLRTYEETIPHELSHVVYEKIPEAVKQKLTKTIMPFISRKEIKSDLIKNGDGYVKSWKDGLTLPRYSCVHPYGASNPNEFVAEYVGDIYGRGGRKIAVVLKGDYRQDAVKALEAMKEAGFLGATEEAYVTIGKVLERAGR